MIIVDLLHGGGSPKHSRRGLLPHRSRFKGLRAAHQGVRQPQRPFANTIIDDQTDMPAATQLDAAGIARLAGSDLEYRYRELPRSGDAAIRHYVMRTRARGTPLASDFNDDRNAEWFIRSYVTLKLVLSSTLLANTALYARNRNLQAVKPYLSYYLMLNCCRAFFFTLPCMPWQGLTSIEMTYSKILKVAADKLKR